MRRAAYVLADWALLLGIAGVAVNVAWRGVTAGMRALR